MQSDTGEKASIWLKDVLIDDSQFKLEGHDAADPSKFAAVSDVGRDSTRGTNDFNQAPLTSVNGCRMNFSSEWQVGAACRQDIGQVFPIGNGIYGKTFDLSATSPGFDYGNVGQIDNYGLATDIGYDVSRSFTVKVELSYVDLDLPAGIDDYDQTRGILEFRRDF